MEEIRENIIKKAESICEWLAPRPWSATKIIQCFDRKQETAVMRMARLGAIEEELEEPSLAELREEQKK